MGGWNEFYIKKKWFFLKKVKKNEKNWKKLKKMHQKWVAGCLCGQNMKNYEWNSCKKLWKLEGVNKFYITKLIFSKKSWKKSWKKLKKNEKKCVKSELLGASVAKIWKIMNEFHVKSSEHGGVLTNFT